MSDDESNFLEDLFESDLRPLIRGADKADSGAKRLADRLEQNGIATVGAFVSATTQVGAPRTLTWAQVPMIVAEKDEADRVPANALLAPLKQDAAEHQSLIVLMCKVDSKMKQATKDDEGSDDEADGGKSEVGSVATRNGDEEESSKRYEETANAFAMSALQVYKQRTRYSPAPAEIVSSSLMLQIYRDLNQGQWSKRYLEYYVAKTHGRQDFTDTMIGDDVAGMGKFVLRTGTVQKARLETVAQVLLAMERRGLTMTIVGGTRILPSSDASGEPLAPTVVRDGNAFVRIPKGPGPDGKETYEKDVEQQHCSPQPWRRYSSIMHQLAATGVTVKQLLDADILYVDHVYERMSTKNENVGTAAVATLEWPPFATLTAGVGTAASHLIQPAKRGGRGAGTGGLNKAEIKKLINASINGGRGGGPRGGRDPKVIKKKTRGEKKQDAKKDREVPAKMKNICLKFNSPDGCTETNCGRKHHCIACGKKGAKFGHAGCQPA